MKRPVLLVVGAALASVVLTLALQAQEKQPAPTTPPGQPAAVSPSAPAAAEKAAFTFTDEAQMKQFAQVWTQRQATLTRMAVLQGYLNQEQTTLGQLNQDLLSKYNLDVQKNYQLDTERKVLLEREQPPQQPGQSANDQAQQEPAGSVGEERSAQAQKASPAAPRKP